AWSVDSIGWSKRGWKTTLMDVLAGRKTGGVVKIQSWFEDRLQDLPDDPNNELMIPEDPECNKEASNDVSLTSSGQCNSHGKGLLARGSDLLDRSEIPPYLNGKVPGEILAEVENLAANCNEIDLKEFDVVPLTFGI
ncbi:hypothetical protein HN873_071879, partial [Arachis hypogaea]